MEELRKIKKLYGEKMSHFCRENFPTILESEGVLLNILIKNFHPNKLLYEDLITYSKMNETEDILLEFKNYIFKQHFRFERHAVCDKSPKELLAEVGYILYECHSGRDVQQFKKYYAPGEELCTFDHDRTKRCHVFFAVKTNALEIKRKEVPKREDEYGTSVISIQFTKDDICMLSIKNRYNHTVGGCDATFSNNLDNIIEGLTDSFEKEYGLIQQIKQGGFEIPSYVKANDGKFYKYNEEINNIYYCADNIIIDNFKVKKYDKSRYLIMNCFILDLVEKKLFLYDNTINECFHKITDNIEKIEIKKDEKQKIVKLLHFDGNYTIITLNEVNCIIGLESTYYKEIEDNFLRENKSIKKVNIKNVKNIGKYFIQKSALLEEVILENTENIDDFSLSNSYNCQIIDCPILKKVGLYFFGSNKYCKKVSFLELEEVGYGFFLGNTECESVFLPKIKIIGNNFMSSNTKITEVNFPDAISIGDDFFSGNEIIEKLDLQNVKKVGHNFCRLNNKVKVLVMDNLKIVGQSFMEKNTVMEMVSFESLMDIGRRFLLENISLTSIRLPNAILIEDFFINANSIINDVFIPNATFLGGHFLGNNMALKTVDFPKVKTIKNNFMYLNPVLEVVKLPSVQEIHHDFLKNALGVHDIYLSDNLNAISKLSLSRWIPFNDMLYTGDGHYRRMTFDEYYGLHLGEGQGRK